MAGGEPVEPLHRPHGSQAAAFRRLTSGPIEMTYRGMKPIEHGNALTALSTGDRSLPDAMRRGARLRCPACGHGRLFRSYLKVVDNCPECQEELHHHRADDAPPYFTMVIVGHIIVAGVLTLEQAVAPPQWLHLALWLPLTLILSLVLLPPIKGSLVGLQWANRMHGFGGSAEDGDFGADAGLPPGSRS